MTYESSECLFCYQTAQDDFCGAACREAWWMDGDEGWN